MKIFAATFLALVATAALADAQLTDAQQAIPSRALRAEALKFRPAKVKPASAPATPPKVAPAPAQPAPKPAAPAPITPPKPAAPAPVTPPKPAAPAPAAPARPGSKITGGQAVEATIATLSIASAVQPLLPAMNTKKECQQTACWIATSNEACGRTAANQVQSDLMKGREAFIIESTGPTGMWVRYMRTQFAAPDRGAIVTGDCTDGTKFEVTNCQSTGQFAC